MTADMEAAFQDLLTGKADASTAAKSITSSIMSHEGDFLDLYHDFIGQLSYYIEQASNTKDHERLSNLLACVASLPDAVNERPDPLKINGGAGATIIQPGEPITIHFRLPKEHFWRDLPILGLNFREMFNGPEAYLHDHRSPASPEVAKAKWKTINTFLAILMRDHRKDTPAVSDHVQFGFWALAWALEYSPATRIGQNVALHLPAASAWILLAGDTLRESMLEGLNGTKAWEAANGDLRAEGRRLGAVDRERWAFWQRRFAELADDENLDGPTRGAANSAGEWMAQRAA